MGVWNELGGVMVALGEPVRWRVVGVLAGGPRRAGELAKELGMSGPAMSRHLRVLRDAGCVEAIVSDDDARVRVYRLRAEPFVALRAWLDQVEAFWAEQLTSFKEHAEGRK